MLSQQISLFDLLEPQKQEQEPKREPRKAHFWKVDNFYAGIKWWLEQEKEWNYFFKQVPLHYIHLPECNGITLYMFCSNPLHNKGSYAFDGFMYKGQYYSFNSWYYSKKEAESKLQYWEMCVFYYNSISPTEINSMLLNYITKNLLKELKQKEA